MTMCIVFVKKKLKKNPPKIFFLNWTTYEDNVFSAGWQVGGLADSRVPAGGICEYW